MLILMSIRSYSGRAIRLYTARRAVMLESPPSDPKVAELVRQALDPYKNKLADVVGETTTALNRGTSMESTMDNFMLQALLESTGAQLAFSNGWRYGAPIIPGKITLNDLYNIVSMNPPVSTIEITGAELKEMLEENLERTFSCDPYKHMGGYVKRCLGLNVYFKIETPPGNSYSETICRQGGDSGR